MLLQMVSIGRRAFISEWYLLYVPVNIPILSCIDLQRTTIPPRLGLHRECDVSLSGRIGLHCSQARPKVYEMMMFASQVLDKALDLKTDRPTW